MILLQMSSMDELDELLGSGMGFGMGLSIGLIYLAVLILMIVSMWRIFQKVGYPGWASIIPVYNIVTLFKVMGLSPWLVLLYVGCFIPFVNFIAALALLVVNIMGCINLAKYFGKGGGFAAGLILLPFIFYPILAFDNSVYENGDTEPVDDEYADPSKTY